MYNWLRQNYIERINKHLQNAIDDGEMTEEEASIVFNNMITEWENSYGEYMYDMKGDR